MIEARMSLSVVPEDLKVKIHIFGAGTSFMDGTIEKWFTAADFDESGICRYRMLKAPGSSTSLCHGIDFYDGNTFINNSWN